MDGLSKLPGFPLCCKGTAMACHLMPEYEEGRIAPIRSTNPYDFWNEYVKHYAWDIGNQIR
jgi:hypothetical protein